MYRQVLFFSIFIALFTRAQLAQRFFTQAYGFQCILEKLRDKYVPVLLDDEAKEKLCNKTESFESEVHNLMSLCSFEVGEKDISLLVQKTCLKTGKKKVPWNEVVCLLKRFEAVDSCEFDIDDNLPFRPSCLRGLWGYYECLISDSYENCGSVAGDFMTYSVKTLHILARNTCLKTVDE